MTVPQLRAHTLLGVPSQRSDGHHKMVDFGLRKERRLQSWPVCLRAACRREAG